ncbi:MAG: hypothetical protein GC151_06325 [Betaproteobacteria bacterium]|nr:hypothetical protein [Betaproteobacteria bacterium]
MTDRPTIGSEDGQPDEDPVLDRVESLIRRHKGVHERWLPAALPTETDETPIPTLTDLVSPGARTSEPSCSDARDPAPPVTRQQTQDLENEVYRRLQDRLDREIGALLERRVMPELAGSLDYALNHIARELKGSVRQLVREAIEETLNSRVRNLALPLDDASHEAPPGSGES